MAEKFVLATHNPGKLAEMKAILSGLGVEVISPAGARTKGLDNTTLTDCAITFCESVRMAGYTPMVYYNLPVGYLHYQLDRLTAYDVWFAQYASMPSMY